MRRIYALLFILILSLTAGCELEDPSLDEQLPVHTQEQSDKIVDTVFGVAYTEEEHMNPLTTRNKINLELYSLTHEGLFELDENLEPVGVLCESFSAESGTYTFKLKEGVTFSDGSPLRASDVVASLQLAMQPESYYASRLTNITGIRASGNHTVVITTARYTGNLPRLLDVPIIKRGSEADKISPGTGPYVLREEDSSGRYILSAREGWHLGKSRPYSRIDLTRVASVDELIFGFEARDIDVVCVDSTASDPIQFRGEYEARDYITTIMQYIGFNARRGATANVQVRQALARSVDRVSAAEHDFARLADAASLPMHPALAPYNPEIAAKVAYSPLDASALFAAAGYADTDGDGQLESSRGEGLTLTLLVNSENKSRVSMAERIAADLAKLGVTVTVDSKPWAEYNSALAAGRFDMYLAEVNLSADFDISALIRTGGALNYGGYSSSDTDALLDIYNSVTLRKCEQADNFYQNFVLQSPIAVVLFKKNTHITHRGAFDALHFTQRNIFYKFYDWRPVRA